MEEERGARRVYWIAGGAILLLVALRLLPAFENPFAPEPVAAHVALLAGGDGVASDGPHELPSGASFRLFAVLEAKDWRGRPLWFSEAPALRIGGRAIPPGEVRRWPDDPLLRVRWFTVEGFAPFLAVETAADLERFRLNDEFRAEWGGGWSVAGVVDPGTVQLEPDSPLRPLGFGTQRYAVRIERYAAAGAITPELRLASPAAAALADRPEAGTRVVATLPGPLATLSAHCGLTELALAPGLDAATATRAGELVRRGQAFERSPLLAAHLAGSGVAAAELAWRAIDLGVERPAWDGGVAPGDLLQAGPRIVVLLRDADGGGLLDPQDFVFDLWQGLHVRRLAAVFRGEGGVELELASLSAAGRRGDD